MEKLNKNCSLNHHKRKQIVFVDEKVNANQIATNPGVSGYSPLKKLIENFEWSNFDMMGYRSRNIMEYSNANVWMGEREMKLLDQIYKASMQPSCYLRNRYDSFLASNHCTRPEKAGANFKLKQKHYLGSQSYP